jgi:hypothetical protein
MVSSATEAQRCFRRNLVRCSLAQEVAARHFEMAVSMIVIIKTSLI